MFFSGTWTLATCSINNITFRDFCCFNGLVIAGRGQRVYQLQLFNIYYVVRGRCPWDTARVITAITVKPFNLAAQKTGNLACKIILAN